MSAGIFLLLFAVFFVLVAVVVWVVKVSPRPVPDQNRPEAEEQLMLPDELDQAKQWLEEYARKQEQSGTKRLH